MVTLYIVYGYGYTVYSVWVQYSVYQIHNNCGYNKACQKPVKIMVLYCTVLYCTVLYCTKLYYTILYYTILYYTVLYCTILYYTILHYTPLYSVSMHVRLMFLLVC